MLDKNTNLLTRSQAIEQVISQMTGPMDLDEFYNQVLTLSPSHSKNPKAKIRDALRFDFLGKKLLLLDTQTLIPLRIAMKEVRFRVSLSRQELNKGWLFVFPAFQFMAQQHLPPQEFSLEEANGRSIPVNPVTYKLKVNSILGAQEIDQAAFDLKWWYRKHNLRRRDCLLVTVLDWEKGCFQLTPEPARDYQRHAVAIQAANQVLADELYQQLEAARYEEVWGSIAIPTAYLHLKEAGAYPPDHWLEVLEKDPRMQWTGFEIRYADRISPFDRILQELVGETKQTPIPIQKPISKHEAKQVYGFKVSLWREKRIWRRIEIQGKQTLAEFDKILRTAFQHDHSDHLSGFWKLVRRGESRRFREIDLGNVNPFGGGEAEDVLIAGLSLSPGDALKYVYDFGDWIQHRLELEAISEPEENASYPRITGQNKPRYPDCQVCVDVGRKASATWFCYTCTGNKRRDIFLCETCMEAHDEDHYLEEVLL